MITFAPQNRRRLCVNAVNLRVSLTDRCNLRCTYCMPALHNPRTVALSDDELLSIITAVSRVKPVYKLRFTGGDPLLRSGLTELILKVHAKLPEAELGLTTNGVLLAKMAVGLRRAGLATINVSIDTTDAAAFRELSRGGKLSQVLAGIEAAAEAGFKSMKLNAVLLREYNGRGVTDLVRLAGSYGVEIRFIELMPFGEGAAMFDKQSFSAPEALAQLKADFQYVRPLEDTATAHRHLLRDGDRDITVGFITTMSDPFCERCDRIRIDSQGKIFNCIRSHVGLDAAQHVRAGHDEVLHNEIVRLIDEKSMPVDSWPERAMVTLGG